MVFITIMTMMFSLFLITTTQELFSLIPPSLLPMEPILLLLSVKPTQQHASQEPPLKLNSKIQLEFTTIQISLESFCWFQILLITEF